MATNFYGPVTIGTKVDVEAGATYIRTKVEAGGTYNEFSDPQKAEIVEETTPEESTEGNDPGGNNGNDKEDLCHFLYPGIDEEEGKKINKQIKDLVKRFPLKEICSFLKKLEDEQKILLPPDPQFAFSELHRMGLPSEETPGYGYGNFAKCYRNR